MFQPDWSKSYKDLSAVILDLGIEPGVLDDVTPARVQRGFWIESDTDSTFVRGEEGAVRVYVWNNPQARTNIMDLLCRPVWRA
jgi:hypothetical protein